MIMKMSSFRRVEGAVFRWLGVGLVALGLFVAYTRFPTRPAADWASIGSFELDSDECQVFREQRLTTELTVVEQDGALPTYSEVAENFNLELALVCRANGLPDDCGSGVASVEGPLTLPLSRDPAVALPAKAP